jgi:hypothetical protein
MKHGADVKQIDCLLYTPLHVAAEEGTTDVVKFLVDRCQRDPGPPPFDSALSDQSTRLGTCVMLPRGSIQFFCDEVLRKCKEGAR